MIALLQNLAHQLYDVEGIIRWGGLLMLVVIIFAETGLMVGFFLPGDSLLVTAGVFSAAGHLELWTLLAAVTAAAIVGDQVGYWIGYRAGPLLFRREDSLLFILPARRYDIRVRPAGAQDDPNDTRWMLDIEVPSDRTRLKLIE